MSTYKNILVLGTCILGACLALSNTAQAQSTCSDRDSIVKVLDQNYKETLSNYGVAGHVMLLEVYVSKVGTFTILASRPNGISCIIAAGDNWETESKPKGLTGF
jgi:hypothetical protein